MGTFTALEQVGSLVTGDALDLNPGTVGGLNDFAFSRTYKVNTNVIQNYLFQILNPSIRVADDTIQSAYLVKQRSHKIDEVNHHLICVFSQIPSPWNESKYQPVPFPGVQVSSLYTAFDFPFRNSTFTKSSQCRHFWQYFLGPINSIPTVPLFQPVDSDGNRTNLITDWTSPSTDEYVSLVNSRGEIVTESVVLPFKGDIWGLRTTYAIAK